jgi:hypothetical protein
MMDMIRANHVNRHLGISQMRRVINMSLQGFGKRLGAGTKHSAIGGRLFEGGRFCTP